MNSAPASLPNDPAALRKIISKQQQKINQLEEFIRLQNTKTFAASSEKAPGQGELFDEAESLDEEDQEALANEREADTSNESSDTRPPKKKSGRKPLPAELPRVRIEHDIAETDKTCDCGCQRTFIGEETSEQLDIIPAKIQVLVHVRKKYACKACEAGVTTALLPPQPLPKSMASPGLLAHIVIAKYQDGLPLYRQESQFKRIKVDLGRSTMARWMIKGGELLQPLWNLLENQLLSSHYIHMDETRVQVLKEPNKTPQSGSYMWVRVSGLPDKKVILFDYAPGRGGEVAKHLLEGFQGHLHTDGYAGYNGVSAEKGIIPLGCWAHARRKFMDAKKAAVTPKGKKAKVGKADMALSLIGKLYAIEKQIKDKSAQERHAIRQRNGVPILKKLRQWLDRSLQNVLPKGLLGKALGYLDRQWDKLITYTEKGYLNIDNNSAENAIRPFVIGRKNWLFSDSQQGAKASGLLYSLIETAKANRLEPFAYLSHVFKELPKAQSLEDAEDLLPWSTRSQKIAGLGSKG